MNLDKIVKLLKEAEWACWDPRDMEETSVCFSCGGYKPGHKDGCEWVAVLTEIHAAIALSMSSTAIKAMRKYEKKCSQCKCEYPHRYHCDSCDKLGYVPTDEGEEILIFLRRHGFVQVRE